MILDRLPSKFLNAMSLNDLCVLYVFLYIILSQAGLSVYNFVCRKFKEDESNEVAGIMYGCISAIYSLLLAFIIVAVWGNYEDLNKTIETESDKLSSILSQSANLPDSIRLPIDRAIGDYCRQVVNEQWHMKGKGETDRPSAIPGLRVMLLKVDSHDKMVNSVFHVIDDDLTSINSLRRNRLSYNRSQVPDLVWFILKIGSLMLVLFSYFFRVPSLKRKRVYLFFLTGFIAMCMFLIYELDHPFDGRAMISSSPYSNIILECDQH
jgi:Protein of unknown function (DUF4239)